MGVEFLDGAARAELGTAIRAIEAASAVEVIVAVRKRSGTYHHANAIVGGAVAAAALALALFAEPEFSPGGILLAPIVLGIVAAFAAELAPPLKRLLTPRAHLRATVERAARATFVERGVHNTAGRTGVLAYVALLEQLCVLVPDSALAAQLPDETRAQVEAAMTGALPAGGAAVARALAELAPHCARVLPRAADDLDELPDLIDTEAGEVRA